MGLCHAKQKDKKTPSPSPKLPQVHFSIRYPYINTFQQRNMENMSRYRKRDYHFASSRTMLVKAEDQWAEYQSLGS